MSTKEGLREYRSRVEAIASKLLQRNPSPSGRAVAVRAIHTLAEETLAGHPQQREHIACAPGCGTCCQVNVAVLDAEADAIYAYLRQRLTPGELEDMRQAAHRLHLQVGGLNDEERLLARRPCLFLDPGQCCSIYPVRPLLCRSITSTDPEQCREAVGLAALDRSPPILCHLWQQQLFQETYLGLAAVLRQRGEDDRGRQLTEAIWQRLQ